MKKSLALMLVACCIFAFFVVGCRVDIGGSERKYRVTVVSTCASECVDRRAEKITVRAMDARAAEVKATEIVRAGGDGKRARDWCARDWCSRRSDSGRIISVNAK